MSENVGLSTPRGSGTSGHVQRSLAHIRHRDRGAPYNKDKDDSFRHRPRQPDQGILEHERKREVELKVFELRDKLEEEEVDEDEIDDRCDALRKKLLAELAAGKNVGGAKKAFKQHQVHEMADAKMKETERLRRALGVRADYEEGSHWKRQEEKQREAAAPKDEPSPKREQHKRRHDDYDDRRHNSDRRREEDRERDSEDDEREARPRRTAPRDTPEEEGEIVESDEDGSRD